jgi:hypothetical protein
MRTTQDTALSLRVRDVSGQKVASVEQVPTDATVGELVDRLLEELRLPTLDATGRPLTYQARYDREGRHLNAAERLTDAVEPGSQLTLLPNVNAG